MEKAKQKLTEEYEWPNIDRAFILLFAILISLASTYVSTSEIFPCVFVFGHAKIGIFKSVGT